MMHYSLHTQSFDCAIWISRARTASFSKQNFIFTINRSSMSSYFQKLRVLGQHERPLATNNTAIWWPVAIKTLSVWTGHYSLFIRSLHSNNSSPECFFLLKASSYCLQIAINGASSSNLLRFLSHHRKHHRKVAPLWCLDGALFVQEICLSLKNSSCPLNGTQPRQTGFFITLSCEHLPYGCVAKCACVC